MIFKNEFGYYVIFNYKVSLKQDGILLINLFREHQLMKVILNFKGNFLLKIRRKRHSFSQVKAGYIYTSITESYEFKKNVLYERYY